MQKLKLFGCFAVLKCHIFVGTRKKTRQCCRLARLFDAVTAKRGRFKTVLSSTLLCLRKALMERGFLQAHSYSVGTSIEKDDFINENFVPKDTFVFVGYRDNLDLADAAVVDSGMYACVYLDSFDDEIDFAKKLLEHCKEQNWTVCGDYFCKIMTEFNVFDNSRRSMFLRLQVPVNFAR